MTSEKDHVECGDLAPLCSGSGATSPDAQARQDATPSRRKAVPGHRTPKRLRRVLMAMVLVGVVGPVLAIVYASYAVAAAAEGWVFDDIGAVEHRRVGLVPGCSKLTHDGRMNLYFQYRIAAAAELFKAGKVDYLLVSGDNHRHGYDEPSDMRDSLIAAGVPADRIECDYAGFRTLDSVVRAKEVFGQSQIIIISQRFHVERAIYIAAHRGVDAVGFVARDVTAGYSGKTKLREQLARVKTVLDVRLLRTQPRFLGPTVVIGARGVAGPLAKHSSGKQ